MLTPLRLSAWLDRARATLVQQWKWGVLLGLVGAVLIMLGGWGDGAVPSVRTALASWLGTHLGDTRSDREACKLLAMVGVAVMSLAWLLLLPVLSRSSLRQLIGVNGLWALPLCLTPPLFSADATAYSGQAQLVAQGINPYTFGPSQLPSHLALAVDHYWRLTPSPYGPLFLRLASPLTVLAGDHPLRAVFLMRGLALLGVALLMGATILIARRLDQSPQRALWFSTLAPLSLIHLVGGAHNEALMLGLLALGVAFALRDSMRALLLGIVLVCLAGLIKAPAFLALAFLPLMAPQVSRLRARRALVVVASAPALLWLLGAVLGLGWGWVAQLRAGSARPTALSLLTLLARFVAHRGAHAGLSHLGVAAVYQETLQLGTPVLALVLRTDP